MVRMVNQSFRSDFLLGASGNFQVASVSPFVLWLGYSFEYEVTCSEVRQAVNVPVT